MDPSAEPTLLRAAIEQAKEPIVLTTAELAAERGPRIVFVNPAFTQVTGYTAEEVIGQTPRILQGPATDRAMLDRLRQALERGERFEGETWNYRKDGTPYRIQWSVAPVSLDGQQTDYFLAVQRDVTEQWAAEQALAEREAHYRDLVESHPLMVGRFLPDGTLTFVNRTLAAFLGAEPEALEGTHWPQLLDTAGQASARRHLAAFTPEAPLQHLEEPMPDATGEQRWVRWTTRAFFDGHGEPTHFQAVGIDVTEQRRAEQERLHYYANFNTLTGLPGRRYTLRLLEDALERARNAGTRLALAALEISQLEQVFQGYGDEVGEALLRRASEGLQARIAGHPILLGSSSPGRFLLALEGVRRAEPSLAARVRGLLSGLEADLAEQRPDLIVRARAGVATYPEDGEASADLVSHAEAALSLAPREGRAISFAEPSANARLRQQLGLEAELHRAYQRGEFFLVYQPQFDLTSGRVVGAEALLRWQHPERGVVSPASFIPLLEETGLIEPVGEWVLAEAIGQAKAWHDAGHRLTMAVNLAPRQLRSERLVTAIQDTLARTGYPAASLELEITESELLESRPGLRAVLDTLRDDGIGWALDDFGTGYSALSYLQAFPLQVLKVDRSFVAEVEASDHAEALLWGIIALSKALRMGVVAEGIETEAQRSLLVQLGCDRGQGFGLAHPLRAADFTALLAGAGELYEAGVWAGPGR